MGLPGTLRRRCRQSGTTQWSRNRSRCRQRPSREHDHDRSEGIQSLVDSCFGRRDLMILLYHLAFHAHW